MIEHAWCVGGHEVISQYFKWMDEWLISKKLKVAINHQKEWDKESNLPGAHKLWSPEQWKNVITDISFVVPRIQYCPPQILSWFVCYGAAGEAPASHMLCKYPWAVPLGPKFFKPWVMLQARLQMKREHLYFQTKSGGNISYLELTRLRSSFFCCCCWFIVISMQNFFFVVLFFGIFR